MIPDHAACFARLAGLSEGAAPHPWQADLAESEECGNRLIRIPTGMGKTFGVLAAWAWHRLLRGDERWPRRLVWCLPMRVLVEQVVAEIEAALARLGGAAGQVQVHKLLGGVEAGEWQLWPEREAVLVGTQDMLLSRALNRGYAAPRARWPMDFGLLNQDALWVMDEVQLMDVGLATSGQLQAFREQDAALAGPRRPCRTWWMSATLQPAWLQASPDVLPALGQPQETRIAPAARRGALWDDVHKPLRVVPVADAKKLAALVAEAHLAARRGADGPTLVVVNRVETAGDVIAVLAAHKLLKGTELRLVHSRFRPAERAGWRDAFLNRAACGPGTDRIVVATQVVEAGVDMSAAVLVTELAPWSSLVQRFGRAARWGGTAQLIVADGQPKDDKAALPYVLGELQAAREALEMLGDGSPRELEAFEDAHAELLPRLYRYEPRHLLMRNELDELFDTSADLSGADIDVSRFIRSGTERDLQVFWRDVPADARKPADALRAHRDELCGVPFVKAQEWLCGKGQQLDKGKRAWVWDWVEGEWTRAERRQLYPGQTVLVASECGGYDLQNGWSPKSAVRVTPVAAPAPEAAESAAAADGAENDESLSAAAGWQTIAFHGLQVAQRAMALSGALAPELVPLFGLAGRWHDAGKAHPAFQGSLLPHGFGSEIAKAPSAAWLGPKQLYPMPDGTRRRGLRHELASTLALFALLRRCQIDHPALLGPWRELLSQLPGGDELPLPCDTPANLGPLEQEVLALDTDAFDLLLYLVCAHHGKVRMSWHASPADQAAQDDALRIRGLRTGDVLPSLTLADREGGWHRLPAADLVLAPAAAGLNPHTGRGWTERVLGLLQRHGPFALAWLEALLRAADQRATREALQNDDPLILDRPSADGLETSDRALARAAGGREAPAPLGEHPAQRGAQLRTGGRAGGLADAAGRTRQPADATRYLQTRYGALSYLELAPHLALAAQRVESEIVAGAFDERALDDQLVAELHRRLCGEHTPQFAGWRREAVLVGTHTPPEPHQVPLLMREYALDLQARLQAAQAQPAPDESLLEALAFAEGRLLSIHPFGDFNGRATRLFLRLLLRRLDLPDVDLAPSVQYAQPYFEALRAGDRRDWRALVQLWRQRFESAAIGGRP